jgi:hypothetical protein
VTEEHSAKPEKYSAKSLPSVTLDKESSRQRKTTVTVPGDGDGAKCIPVPRVLLSANVVVTESMTLPSAALGNDLFAECPAKNTRQSVERSAKTRIPVVPYLLYILANIALLLASC